MGWREDGSIRMTPYPTTSFTPLLWDMWHGWTSQTGDAARWLRWGYSTRPRRLWSSLRMRWRSWNLPAMPEPLKPGKLTELEVKTRAFASWQWQWWMNHVDIFNMIDMIYWHHAYKRHEKAMEELLGRTSGQDIAAVCGLLTIEGTGHFVPVAFPFHPALCGGSSGSARSRLSSVNGVCLVVVRHVLQGAGRRGP